LGVWEVLLEKVLCMLNSLDFWKVYIQSIILREYQVHELIHAELVIIILISTNKEYLSLI